MGKVSEIDELLQQGADQRVRRVTRDAVKTGTPLTDLAETFIDTANSRLMAGDVSGCSMIIWQAVHDGVPIHELLRQAKELGAREVLDQL